jgi:hypothetical protein
VPRITDFCICIYVFGCRLSLFRLCDSDFGNTPVDDVNNINNINNIDNIDNINDNILFIIIFSKDYFGGDKT